MFVKLRLGIEEDIKVRNGLRKKGDEFKFDVAQPNAATFSITREHLQKPECLDFFLTSHGVTIRNSEGQIVQDAALTLTDEGECKFRLMSKEEVTCWQFRKRVLEDLFFNF